MHDWISKLERAKALLDAGALTPAEYEAEKARLLPTPTALSTEQIAATVADHQPTSSRHRITAIVAAALAAVVAAIGYISIADDPPEESAQRSASTTRPMVKAMPVPFASATPAPTSVPTVAAFGCMGAYSNISFSEESGDGSGLLVRIGKRGRIKWSYYEGGVSRGEVTEETRSAERITGVLHYVDDPSEVSSSVELICKAGRLSVRGVDAGDRPLLRLTAKQAADLDV